MHKYCNVDNIFYLLHIATENASKISNTTTLIHGKELLTYELRKRVMCPASANAVNVRHVKQGTEAAGFRAGRRLNSLHSCQYVRISS